MLALDERFDDGTLVLSLRRRPQLVAGVVRRAWKPDGNDRVQIGEKRVPVESAETRVILAMLRLGTTR
jgi:hypothetical protein